jgi:hypothetical protein
MIVGIIGPPILRFCGFAGFEVVSGRRVFSGKRVLTLGQVTGSRQGSRPKLPRFHPDAEICKISSRFRGVCISLLSAS